MCACSAQQKGQRPRSDSAERKVDRDSLARSLHLLNEGGSGCLAVAAVTETATAAEKVQLCARLISPLLSRLLAARSAIKIVDREREREGGRKFDQLKKS